MIWYFQDEILAHQQQYQAVFISPEEEFWGTHLTTESFDLLICTLKVLQVARWTPDKRTQDHKQL